MLKKYTLSYNIRDKIKRDCYIHLAIMFFYIIATIFYWWIPGYFMIEMHFAGMMLLIAAPLFCCILHIHRLASNPKHSKDFKTKDELDKHAYRLVVPSIVSKFRDQGPIKRAVIILALLFIYSPLMAAILENSPKTTFTLGLGVYTIMAIRYARILPNAPSRFSLVSDLRFVLTEDSLTIPVLGFAKNYIRVIKFSECQSASSFVSQSQIDDAIAGYLPEPDEYDPNNPFTIGARLMLKTGQFIHLSRANIESSDFIYDISPLLENLPAWGGSKVLPLIDK